MRPPSVSKQILRSRFCDRKLSLILRSRSQAAHFQPMRALCCSFVSNCGSSWPCQQHTTFALSAQSGTCLPLPFDTGRNRSKGLYIRIIGRSATRVPGIRKREEEKAALHILATHPWHGMACRLFLLPSAFLGDATAD